MQLSLLLSPLNRLQETRHLQKGRDQVIAQVRLPYAEGRGQGKAQVRLPYVEGQPQVLFAPGRLTEIRAGVDPEKEPIGKGQIVLRLNVLHPEVHRLLEITEGKLHLLLGVSLQEMLISARKEALVAPHQLHHGGVNTRAAEARRETGGIPVLQFGCGDQEVLPEASTGSSEEEAR